MRALKSILAVSAAALTFASAQAAHAESRGYVVSLFTPAMNNVDDTDCPDGKNPNAVGILERVLTEQGMPKAERDKILAPGVFDGGVFAQHATMRGRIDGKPVNVYHNPLSVPDPNIKLATTKSVYGFNLDGKNGPGEGTDPLTGETGVDNQSAKVFGCFDRTRGTLQDPPANQSNRWTYATYSHSWLVEITNNKAEPLNLKNEDNVELTIYRGFQPPIRGTSTYQYNMTYDVDPDPRFQNNKYKGKIRDGLFVSDAPVSFFMTATTRIQPIFEFKQSKLRMSFKPDGSLEGFLGGYVPIKNVYFPFGNYASGAEFNGGVDIPGVFHALRKLADTDLEKDTQTGARTHISQTYLMRAVPAFLVKPDTPKVVASAPASGAAQ